MVAITRRRTLNILLASTASIAWLAVNAPVHAQSPQAPTVAAGSIAVTRQGATTVVSQTTDRGIIDWRSFSIGAGEAVRFDQPGRSSVTLNRVTGSELSRIDGNLSANGQVWLANPNGVLIGNSGQANVGGLLATTGRIDAAEFLKSGRAAIDQIGKEAGIANFGTVNIAEGGYAALAAASIRNEGVVAARKGSVALGAGKAVTVDFTGDKLITFQVTKPLDQAVPGDSMISGGGVIAAEGGTVLMSARAAKGVMDNVINLKGHVVANSVNIDGGTVSFGDGGVVQVSGKIDASNPSGKGGQVAILGEKVGLMDGASVDASGSFGGGTVLVGGDWQGKGPSHNATIAYVAPTASINADATMAGDGGKVVVWADDSTRFNGSISARGGILAGNGGQVETSGKRALDVSPQARVTSKGRAAGAKAGDWLLDPTDITIVATGGAVALSGGSFTPVGASTTIDVGVINTALNNGDNVTLQTASAGSGAGDITFASGTITTSFSGSALTLKLLASRDISFLSGTKIDLSGAAHNIILNSGATAVDQASLVGGIKVEAATIKTAGGYIWLVGGPSQAWAARASADLGAFGSGVYLNNAVVIDAGAGSFKAIGAGRDVAGSNQFSHGFSTTSSVSITANGGLSITGTGGSAGGDEWRGVNLVSSTINVSSGDVIITGVGGSTSGAGGSGGASGTGVMIQSMTMNLGSGKVSITGTAGSGGTSEQNVGVLMRGTSALTSSGAMTITGVGGGASGSSKNYGVSVQASSITLTGTGTVKLDGTRGVGGNSYNIDIASGAAVSSDNGGINLIGTATTGGGVGNFGDGLRVAGSISTINGAINMEGVGALVGASNNGVTVTGTIQATGSGSILIRGGAGLLGSEYAQTAGLVSTNSKDLTLQANSTAVSGTSVLKSGSGTIRLQPYTSSESMLVQPGLISALDGSVAVGKTDMTGSISVADGVTFNNNAKFVTDSGAINFLGAVGGNSGLASLMIENKSGTTSFGGAVGGGGNSFTAVNVSGALRVSGNVTTAGTQSYGGSVVLVSDATFSTVAGDVTFSGAVNSLDGNQSLSTNIPGGTLSLIGGVGQSTALKSLQISDPVALSGAIKTTGTQSYGGLVTLSDNTYLTSTGGSFSFGGSVSGSSKIFSLTTSGVDVTLPTLTVKNLSINTGGGAVSQSGVATVTTNAFIDAGSGDVTLTNTGNSIAELAIFAASNAAVTVSGTMALSNSTVTSLSLTTTGAVTQSGPLSTSSLSLNGGGGVYDLTNSGNTIGSLTANTSKVTVTNASINNLQVGTSGITVDNGLTLTQSGTGLTINGPINLGSSTATLKTDDKIAGSGTISGGAGATLNLDVGATGGSVSTSGGVTVNVTKGEITVDGVLKSFAAPVLTVSPTPPTTTTPNTPTTASSPSVTSNPATASVASQPTQESQPSQASQGSTPSVASLTNVDKVVEADTTPILIGNEPIGDVVGRLIVPINPIPSNENNSFSSSAQEGGGRANIQPQTQPAGGSAGNSGAETNAAAFSAQRQASLVNATAVGALIPPSPPTVASTGAPLAAANTIKVDPADTGGANGQVIARSEGAVGSDVAGAASQSGGSTTVVPGLVVRAPRSPWPRGEPPLAEQASTINEEHLLD